MIGLGVGIDYALFIVTRYREDLHHGGSRRGVDGHRHRHRRAGPCCSPARPSSSRSWACSSWASSSSGAWRSAPSIVVAVTMVASLTLLPALLGFAGKRVEVTRWRGLIAAGLVAIALFGAGLKIPALMLVCLPLAVIVILAGFVVAPLPQGGAAPARRSRSARPRPTGGAASSSTTRGRRSSAVWPSLLVLAIPVLSLRLGFSDEGNFPKDTTTQAGLRPAVHGFGPGFNGPLVLAADAAERHHAGARCAQVVPGRRSRPRVWRSPAPPITSKDGQRRAVAGDPDHGAAGRGHHPAGPPPARRRRCLRPPRAPASRSTSPARWRPTSTSPTTSPPGCRGSSSPCWRCRSCC